MAQVKIKINTIVELDDIKYNISLSPISKKELKLIEKEYDKIGIDSKDVRGKEKEIEYIKEDISLNDELISVTDDILEKKALIMKKKELVEKQRKLSNSIAEAQNSAFTKLKEAEEKMYEVMLNKMVSGEDGSKLIDYFAQYSYQLGVDKMTQVYTDEIKGK